MKITFNFKNFDPSDHLRKYARDRFGKLGKYVPDSENAELQVNLEVEKFRHIADIVLTNKNMHLSAREDSEDMYSTVDLVWDKLESQIRKQRDKDKSRRKSGGDASVRMDVISIDEDASGKRTPIVKETDHYAPKPMVVEEAAMQLSTVENDFLVFLNAESERINVIYRRKAGDFGLIDPGV